MKNSSGRRRFILELLKVAVFNLFHEGFALEEKLLKLSGELARHYEKLVVNHFRKRDGPARGNQMRAPLEHETRVPENEDDEDGGGRRESDFARMEEMSGAVKKNAEAENEERGQRNKKTVAVGRDAGPIGVTGNEKKKRKKGCEKRSADTRFPTPEEE